MDFLKRELEKKRKLAQEEFGGKKFVRRGEIEKRRLEQIREDERKDEERKKALRKQSKKGGSDTPAEGADKDAAPFDTAGLSSSAQVAEDEIDKLVISRVEVVKRLRMLKQPITLFGEDDVARLQRLKHIMRTGEVDPDSELLEGQRNDYLRDLAEMKKSEKQGSRGGEKAGGKDGKKKGAGGSRGAEFGDEEGAGSGDDATGTSGAEEEEKDVDAKRLQAVFEELCPEDKILVFFKKLLKEWRQEVDSKSEQERRTIKGKAAMATYKQCARYLEPLFRACRAKHLPLDIRDALVAIVNECGQRDYLAATDRYIKLAIGNAPWPIGVTMVGIHERSAREKIHASSVAHVMNDETTRKYLQSVKRLMTLCQRRYPAAPSKSVEFNSLANGSDLESLLALEQQQQQQAEGEKQQKLLLTDGSRKKGSGPQGPEKV